MGRTSFRGTPEQDGVTINFVTFLTPRAFTLFERSFNQLVRGVNEEVRMANEFSGNEVSWQEDGRDGLTRGVRSEEGRGICMGNKESGDWPGQREEGMCGGE